MDKNTIIAIILSVIVISVGLTIQSTFFAPTPVEASNTPTTTAAAPILQSSNDSESVSAPDLLKASASQAWDTSLPGSLVQVGGATPSTSRFTFETEVFIVEFDPVGASVSSLRLKKHLDKGQPVEMIFNDGEEIPAFLLYPGDSTTNPIDAVFSYRISGNKVIFQQNFAIVGADGKPSAETFTLQKTYNFGAKEYLSKSRSS